jgi:lipocalin
MWKQLFCLLVACLVPVAASAGANLPPVQVAQDVDFERYAGLWYEVARTPNLFQIACVCTTANYTLLSEDSIGILNACNNLWPRGSLRRAEGVGVVADPADSSAKLEIGFFGAPPSADYWILDVVDDPANPTGPYRFAVVGGPNRDFLFVLSRTPDPRSLEDKEVLRGIRDRLLQQQYPTWNLFRSPQPRTCRYEDRVP